ncbi:sulfite exporter TauE/SafE family protein [Patescibacteria group bacterium]|nr:sulfite exporter TauE/SafE family protein [Patescibacteria group bacterium]
MKKHTFYVTGTHCASCKILIEDILKEQDFIKNVRVDLKKEIVEIETDSGQSAEELVAILTNKTKLNGYIFSLKKEIVEEKSDDVIWKAIPIGLIFSFFFFLLQKSGIFNLSFGSETTPVTGFIIGIIASFSSCLAIVGGLVLSLSATVAEEENSQAKKPLILFHAGRLFGFALLGGILGLIGEVIGVSFIFSAILGLLASIVMVLLGINLLGIFKKSTITLPSNIFSFFRKVEHTTLAPIVVGIGTFFLPCGFTQAMQISALSSGSFISGFLIMFSFALGTLPVLALLSFSSVSFAHSQYAPLFFKSAGVVVIILALFNLINGLAAIGIISPIFNF